MVQLWKDSYCSLVDSYTSFLIRHRGPHRKSAVPRGTSYRPPGVESVVPCRPCLRRGSREGEKCTVLFGPTSDGGEQRFSRTKSFVSSSGRKRVLPARELSVMSSQLWR
ncbi:hypothetical protein FJTKL_11265 [Diaporthe vaccinii]|uniref:Uncharacterized protein n=1 Tax=Diaporthe vaccinii TaxID=105482 RepID=A0ABR4EH70_9PEZI